MSSRENVSRDAGLDSRNGPDASEKIPESLTHVSIYTNLRAIDNSAAHLFYFEGD